MVINKLIKGKNKIDPNKEVCLTKPVTPSVNTRYTSIECFEELIRYTNPTKKGIIKIVGYFVNSSTFSLSLG